ncbi:MAG: acyl carrier protein [Lachnospiraceae bacterium]|nr:acyl carrier protein [Lachnospiraceae bacterium]
MDNFEKVKELLVDQLYLSDPDAVTPDAEIKALGADSLDIMSLLMAIEDQYGIKIPDDKLASFVTVGDIVEYLETL